MTEKKRVTLYLDGYLWLAFRAACIQRELTASKLVNIFVQEQMDAWAMADHGFDVLTEQENQKDEKIRCPQ